MPEVTYVAMIPDFVDELHKIPYKDRPKDEAEFWRAVAQELATCIREAAIAKQPEIIFSDLLVAAAALGSPVAYIFTFSVRDLALPGKPDRNWYGDNTSQRLYAGDITVSAGKVRRHH